MSTTLKEGLIWCDRGAHSYSQGKHQQPSLNMLEQAPMDPQPLLMMRYDALLSGIRGNVAVAFIQHC
jgi:hypothetical protein